MLAYVLALVVMVISALLAFGLAELMHLAGAPYVIFIVVLLLLGITAAIAIVVIHHRKKKQAEIELGQTDPQAISDLDLFLNDADKKLRAAKHGRVTLQTLPLVYILGDAGSAKTTVVVKSGLNPELLAGTASDQEMPPSTPFMNLWFTGQATLLEAGDALRNSGALLARLVHRTRAKGYRAAFGRGAAPRAVIVCLSMDQLLLGDGGDALMLSARAKGAQLRDISRILGMPVPIYVIVTKLDRVPHFERYVQNLTDEEVRHALGLPLSPSGESAGTYADVTSRKLSKALDELVFRLNESRIELLDRETDPVNLGGVYEFPREFGKLKKRLNDYLVELCKPSQLSANPYLRGFYFTGIRARVVEARTPALASAEQPLPADAGATQYINLSVARSTASRVPAPAIAQGRIPQWTFLARLLPELILGDRTALAATRQSAPAKLFRRFLFGTLAALFLLYGVALAISYSNNLAIEKRIVTAVQALPQAYSAAAPPTSANLHALDDLRQTIVQLGTFNRGTPPLRYRWGLYRGKSLETSARGIYFDRFRSMILDPAQTNLSSFLKGLPNTPANSDDFDLYNAAYNPLKAYLITTSDNDKSQPKFQTPVIYQYWAGGRQWGSEEQQLAEKQIDFYGNELLRLPPYSIKPDSAAVDHSRAYLANFLAKTRIYQAMLNDADKGSPAIDFNKQYPGSAPLVVDGHIVRGAFTKNGFGFMQNALQHPEKYAQGEVWVLGKQTGAQFDPIAIAKDLSTQYTTDFVKEWHTFLTVARVSACGNLKEASSRLNALAGPASPLLELFYTASHNTAIANDPIKTMFKPTQILVDPNATDQLIGPGNKDYVTAIGQLAGTVELASQNPAATTDIAAFMPVSQAVEAADGAARQTSRTFNVDQQMHTEATVLALMQAPLQCVAKLAPSPGAAANGGGQKMCAAISPLLAKYPFERNSGVPATVAETDSIFAPDTGAFWTNYNATLKPYIVQQGVQWVTSPQSPQPVSPRFLQYFTRAARVSAALYPAPQKSASLSFTLQFLPGNGVSSATLVVDGQQITTGATTQRFTWMGATATRASLIYDGNEALVNQGTWALFQLVRIAQISRTAGGYRLDYPINTATTVAGHTINGSVGAAKTASFELTGPGAEFLVGDGFAGLSCVAPVVK